MAKFLFYDDKIINILLQEEKPSGGAAVQAYGWIKGLSEIGHEIYILTNLNQDVNIKTENKELKVIPLYDPDKGIRWFRWIYFRIPYIYKIIKKNKCDYLYQGIPGWKSLIIGCICYLLQIKYISRISNDIFFDKRFLRNNSRIHKYLMLKGLSLSHFILCQNEYQLQKVKELFPKKKVLKISNPVYLAPSQSLPITKKNYIAWIGIFQYQKNLKLLYAIAYSLKNESFYVAGKESSKCDVDTKYYLKKIERLPNVKMVGFLSRDQVLPFLSGAKFLLNTSHYEGFSNTFLEAMTVQTPIITTEHVNPDSIIDKYQLGILYDPENINELANQLSSITSEKYAVLGNALEKYLTLQHNYKILSKKLNDYLESEN